MVKNTEVEFRVSERREHENGQWTLQLVPHNREESGVQAGGLNIVYPEGEPPWKPGQVLTLKSKS